MYRFLIIIEQGEHNYSAYVPDLPGCIATGRTRQEVEQNMREAIALHVQAMLEDGEPIPVSQSIVEYVDISVPDSAA
ncbi:MAG: type II toxin-antitoxin system HicB family antitoxin [Chloroflexi bacterium]|nr:type II toxin-antitoxin system HicB family antitoxin [Chloroflexota bacterium]